MSKDTQIIRTCPQSAPQMKIVVTLNLSSTKDINEEVYGHTAGMIYNALCDYGFDENQVSVDIWTTGGIEWHSIQKTTKENTIRRASDSVNGYTMGANRKKNNINFVDSAYKKHSKYWGKHDETKRPTTTFPGKYWKENTPDEHPPCTECAKHYGVSAKQCEEVYLDAEVLSMTNKIKFPTFCADCGYPIQTHQIGTTIKDCPPDFVTRQPYVDVEFDLCEECWERIKTNVKRGMNGAMKKRRELLKEDATHGDLNELPSL